MKKIFVYLFICLFVCEVEANETSIELPLDEKAQLQLQMYPTPMTETEKKEICQLVKDGKYEEMPFITYQEANIDKGVFEKMLEKVNFPYTVIMSDTDKTVTLVDYNNDGTRDKLVRVMYDRSGGNGAVYTYYVILDGAVESIIQPDNVFHWFPWDESIKEEKMYDIAWRGGGQRIIKIKNKYYLVTLDREPFFDKVHKVYPNYKGFKRTIERVDLIKTYPDGKNINHIVCEF